jgi:hypothetical protein
LGNYVVIAFGLWGGTGALYVSPTLFLSAILTISSAYAASIVVQINADIGPNGSYVWNSLVFNVCSAVW